MTRLITTLLLAALCGLLTAGCNGGRETDEITFVQSLAFDVAPDNRVIITFRLAKPTAPGGGEPGNQGGSDTSSAIVSISAASPAVARDILNSEVARVPNLSHVNAIVVGEELARKGLGDLIVPLIRYREFRGSMYIFVAHGTTAEKILRSNKPPLERSIPRYVEGMMATAGQSGYYLQTFFHDFYLHTKAASGSPCAALIGINPLSGREKLAAPAEGPEKTDEYYLEGVGIKGGNPVMVLGTALFRGDRMVGTLTSEESRMLSILTGRFDRGYLSVRDPLEPGQKVTVNIRPGRRPKITASLADGRPVIDVDVFMEGVISNIASGVNYENEKYRPLLEEQISQIIRADMVKTIAYTQQVGSDPVNFGKYFRSLFRTYKEFEQFDFDSRYPTAEVNVKVKTNLRRTGLMWKTSPIRDRN